MSPLPSLNRRRFLSLTLAAGCGCLLAPWWSPGLAQAELEASYYLRHTGKLLNDFEELNQGARQYLNKAVGPAAARVICYQAPRQFQLLLPKLPGVGGAKNPDTQYLFLAAELLAYWRPFLAQGLKAKDLGRMLYVMHRMEARAMPRKKALALGAARFTPAAQKRLRGWCAWTQQRYYPGNWAAVYVPGRGRDFDFGYNILKCAVVMYFAANGARQLAPYFCLNDFIRSKSLGTGLVRRGTIAQGDPICDFRYKLGRPVSQDWDSEVPRFQGKVFN